jgi:antitoxin YefM
MNTTNVSDARKNIYKLIDKVNQEKVEILITGKRNNAVLISEGDWNAIKETLYLYETGNAKDIAEGMKTPLEDCEEIDWRNTD